MMEPERVDGADSVGEREAAERCGGEAAESRWERAVRYAWASMSELVPIAGVGSCRSDFLLIFDPFRTEFVPCRSRLFVVSLVELGAGRVESEKPERGSGRIECEGGDEEPKTEDEICQGEKSTRAERGDELSAARRHSEVDPRAINKFPAKKQQRLST